MNHKELNPDGSCRYAPTTLRTWLSMIGKFWEFTQRGDLKKQIPLLESQLGKWEKAYMVKKASTFTENDLIALHRLEETCTTVVWKAFSAIAIAFAARSCEIVALEWKQVSQLHDSVEKSKKMYKIEFKRAKSTTASSTDADYCLISGSLEVNALDRYISCFKPADREG